MRSVFEFTAYKAYLQHQIELNANVKGYRQNLAAQAGCHRTFLSRIFHEALDLTLEQGANLTRFFEMTSLETEYFIELIVLARSGNNALRQISERKLRELRARNEELSGKIVDPGLADQKSRQKYYSSWIFSAVHLLASIPELRKSAQMANKLALSEQLVLSALRELQAMGLVEEKKDGWHDAGPSVHVSKDSPEFLSFFQSWHQKATEDLMQRKKSTHYLGIHSMSEATARRIQAKLNDFIKEAHAEVETSPSEELVFMRCDLFRI